MMPARILSLLILISLVGAAYGDEDDTAALVLVEGRVLDATGAPVAGASVEFMPGGSFEGQGVVYADRGAYARVSTDAQGRFRARGVPEDEIATVIVQAAGCREARIGIKAFGSAVRPSPLVIQLEPGARVGGTVRDAAGEPVAGAQVFVVPADVEVLRRSPRVVQSSTDGPTIRALTAQTNEAGVYEVSGLALDREYAVMAEASGHARTEAADLVTATAADPAVEADIVLRLPARLVIRLVDGEGHVVKSATVRVGGFLGGQKLEAADAAGAFSFEGLAPGSHDLTVDAEGFTNVAREVEVASGAVTELTIVLDAGCVISGVLVDETGKAKAGVSVTAEAWEETSGGWRTLVAHRDETDEEGRFEIRGVSAGEQEVSVLAKGFDLPKPLKVVAPATGLRLQGRHLGTARIRLVAPEGRTLPDRIFVWRHRETERGGTTGSGGGKSHEDGVLLFAGCDGRTERLRIQVEGYVEIERQMKVAPGETADLGEVVLEVGADLRGRVLDRAGRPVAGAVVGYSDYTEATSTTDGAFVLQHLPEGVIEVAVDAEGFLEHEEKILVGAGVPDVIFKVSRGALLKGVLTDREGRGLEDHWVQVRKADGQGSWKEVDYFGTEEDGSFEIRVPTGPCRLVFVRERGEEPIVLAELELKEGERRRLELVLGE